MLSWRRPALEQTVQSQKDELAKLTSDNETLKAERDQLSADNTRLNTELDTAQVGLRSANDEIASLKDQIAKDESDRAKADLASRRAEQVRTLSLFEEKYITDRASAWADLSEEDWGARVEEWRLLKPATTEGTPAGTDSSAMTGTNGDLTDTASKSDEKKQSPRRAALGLPD